MNRLTTCLLLLVLAAAVGLNSTGCPSPTLLGTSEDGRLPPTIEPFGNFTDTFTRSFRVDLHDYPETTRVAWDFGGDGTMSNLPVSTGKSVTHTFTRGGTFSVSVHLFGPNDIAKGINSPWLATGVLPVDVLGPNIAPTARFILVQGTGATGEVQFNAAGSSDIDGRVVRFVWDFGDGTSSEGSFTSHTYNTSGRYVVRLTVTDDRGATATTTRSILSNIPPTADFDFDIDSSNALSVTFNAGNSFDGDGNIASFSWDFGDNSTDGTGQVVTHTYAVPDDYTVVLTVTDNIGTKTTASQVVTVNGSDPFVRSVSPDIGVVDTASLEINIDGENFENGAAVRLRRGATIIASNLVTFVDASTLRATFDLTGAQLGDYNVVVENPDTVTAQLSNGFRVVTANRVRLDTTLGDIVLELVDDAPITTSNFLQYVEDGFYDGTIFHRVIPDFVVQGGGLLPDGSQKPGLRPPIVNEFSPTRSNVRETVAMAKQPSSPDTAQAQFFVNLADNSDNLDNQNGGFTVFARVVEGMDVVDAISLLPTTNGDRPDTDVIINSATRE